MVGKNTIGSKHTEPWKFSSFGPRNIGTGRKYTPSKDNVKVEESTVSQDQNRVTTSKQTGTPNKRTVNWDDPWAVELEIQNAFLTDDYSSFKELSDARIKQLIRDPQEAAKIINGKNGIVTPEKQAAQDMVDNSKPENKQSETIKPDSTRLSLSGDLAYPRKQFPVKNKDILLDYWWQHHLEPQTLNYLYDSGFLKKNENGGLVIDPYIDTWAKKKGFNSSAVRDIMESQTDRSIEPSIASNTDTSSALPNFSSELTKTDVYPSEYLIRDYNPNPAPFRFYPDDMVKPTDVGNYAPIEGKTQVYPPEPSVSNKGAETSVARDFDEKSYLNRDKYNDVKSEIPNTDIAQSRETHAGSYPVPFNRGSWYDLTPIKPDHFDMGPGGYPFLRTGRDPFDFLYLKRDQPSNGGKLTGLGYAGLTGLALLAPYLKQNSTNEQSQTQPPYLMEPESEEETFGLNLPVETQSANEDRTQSEPAFNYQDAAKQMLAVVQATNKLLREKDAFDTYRNAQAIGQRIASGTGYAPELRESNFVFPQNLPEVGSNIKTTGLKSPNGEEVPKELNRLSGVKPKVIKNTSNGPVVLNDPNHRKTRDVQNNSITPEQTAAIQMANQFASIPVEVIRAKNSGYAQPPLNHATDAIWDRVRKAGLVSPEQGIRSGLFTPDEVRYITENDLWRYR